MSALADAAPAALLQHRFCMRRIGAVCTGGLTLCSAYLHDGIGISAPANMALLHSISAALAQIQGPWVLAADWNASPEELHATRWPELAGGVIHAPSVPTCGDRCYDYFVVSRSLQHAVVATLVVSNPGFGPHRPARLFLRASPRTCTIRTIDRPGRFTAELPFGPEHEHDATPAGHVIARATTTAALDVNEVAAKWFREAEAQLSQICYHTPCEPAPMQAVPADRASCGATHAAMSLLARWRAAPFSWHGG